MYNKSNEFFNNCIEDIVRRVDSLKEQTMYPDDIGMEITMVENKVGSWYCSGYRSLIDVVENVNVFMSVCIYMKDEYEISFHMDEIERFHVCAMICMYDIICRTIISEMPLYLTKDCVDINEEFIDEFATAAEKVKQSYYDFRELI